MQNVGQWVSPWVVVTLPITGYPMFDFFFTLIFAGGLLAWMFGTVCRLLTRS